MIRLQYGSRGRLSRLLRPCDRPKIGLLVRFNSTSSRPQHPLKILFCGSDDFSVYSLRALNALPNTIVDSIDVICRPPKLAGRGKKHLRYAPIHDKATALGLDVIPVDTFTGYTPLFEGLDLIVAVSFGLLIPPRILGLAKYGGLNVHPSLLPDLYGPAPILRALIDGDTHGGVTLQTLHPKRFDAGKIVAQTDRPGIPLHWSDDPLSHSIDVLGKAGAEMLGAVVADGRFADYTEPEPESGGQGRAAGARYAAKITSADRELGKALDSVSGLFRRHKIIGPLWDETTLDALRKFGSRELVAGASHNKPPKRLQYGDWEDVTADMIKHRSVNSDSQDTWSDGTPAQIEDILVCFEVDGWRLVFPTRDGGFVSPRIGKVEGENWRDIASIIASQTRMDMDLS